MALRACFLVRARETVVVTEAPRVFLRAEDEDEDVLRVVLELEGFFFCWLWLAVLSSSSGSSPSGRVERLKVALERLSALPFLLVDGDE